MNFPRYFYLVLFFLQNWKSFFSSQNSSVGVIESTLDVLTAIGEIDSLVFLNLSIYKPDLHMSLFCSFEVMVKVFIDFYIDI